VLLSMIAATANLPLALAAEGKTKKSDTAAEAGEASPEIPAPVYLTLALARDAAVHSELGLKASQIDAVQAAIAEVDEPLWQLRDVNIGKVGTQLDTLLSRLKAKLKAALTSQQMERLDQIVLQARGLRALVAADVVERLKLSADQVAKLRTALAAATKEREEMEKEIASQSASSQEQARTRQRKADSKRVSDILSSRQQTDYANLLGKPFDLSRVMQVGCVAPELRGVTAWINSEPLTLKQLRGKVVVVHFWAFGCINCIRNLPHYQGWQEKFADKGVTIVGIQTPETENERKLDLLKQNILERKIAYPVVFDGASENWNAWGNNMWPSVYLIDKQGRVRNWWYGELNWEGAKGEEFLRKRIEELLAEKDPVSVRGPAR
jgi:thiol-disulfide isomerase/thioredoxin